MCPGVSEMASLQKSLLRLSAIYILHWASVLKFRTTQNTLFYEILCKVLLTTHGSENFLVRRRQSPEGIGLGRCRSMRMMDGHDKTVAFRKCFQTRLRTKPFVPYLVGQRQVQVSH
jgi:hypothetical protein